MRRAVARLWLSFTLLLCCFASLAPQRTQAATASGTSITNSMTIFYSDASSNNYNTPSNTVTTLVSGAASLTVTASSQNITIGMIVVDTFTLTNTGNGSGNFQLPSDATLAGTATGTTLSGYVLNAASTGTCSVATPCTLSSLETQTAALSATAAGGTITVGVEYTVTASVSIGQTVITSLTANVLYPAGATAQALSSNIAGSETDTLVADARVDVQETASTPGSSGANITWTVTANNGGNFSARDSLAVTGWVGATGVFISVLLPTFNSSTLVVQSTPTCTLSGGVTGATATPYYSTGSGWTTTLPSPLSNMKWAGCLIHGGSGGAELPSATSGSAGAGNVTTAQVTLTYVTAQPSGNGSGNSNATTNTANAAWEGQPGATGVAPVLGPTIPLGTADSGAYGLGTQEANTTAGSGTTPPGGASNSAGTHAYQSLSVQIGPNGSSNATGAWNASTIPGYTSGTADANHDFTFIGYATTGTPANSASNSAGAPSGNSVSAPTTALYVHGYITNTGNTDDTYTFSNNAISGWTIVYYPTPGGVCNSSVVSGGALTSSQLLVPSGTLYGFCVQATPPATVTAYNAYDFTITATSVANGSVTNITHDVFYPGGSIVTFKTYAVSGCPGGVTPANSGVISGCTITYTVTAVNEAPSVTAGGGSSNISPTPTSIVVTENGTSGDNWGTYSNGITAAPGLSSCASCTTTGTTNSKNFTVTIPSLAPQATATFTYAVVVL